MQCKFAFSNQTKERLSHIIFLAFMTSQKDNKSISFECLCNAYSFKQDN